MKNLRLLLFHLLLLLAAYAFCRLIVGARRRAASAPPPVRRDTLIIRDTLRISRPVPVREEVVRYVTVRVRDSSNLANIGKDSADVLTADTAQTVVLPITQQVYRDTAYTAWISGYAAALDSIEVYPQHKVVTITNTIHQKPKRWGIGLNVGYGITPKNGMQPYVGIGIQYNLFSF